MPMKFALVLAVLLGGSGWSLQAPAATETIVFLRHGEKPAAGLGQLDCQGLNRSLALPRVLGAKFGKPQAIYAPNLSQMMHYKQFSWYYVRPLATIEPTAVYFGLPLEAPYGYQQIDDMVRALTQPQLDNSLVYVAWEHLELVKMVQGLFAKYGQNPGEVPPWPSESDYDSLYVVTIRHADSKPSIALKLESEGLNREPATCPGGAAAH